jgi:hypothetical protein
MIDQKSMTYAARRVGVVLVALLLLLYACDDASSPEPMAECRAGATRLCTGPNGCGGTRACRGAPAHWGACECDAKTAPPPDAGAAVRPRLGAACRRDADCPSHAFCLGTDSGALFGGAPPDGMCVADCSDDERACAQFEDAVCVSVGAVDDDADAGRSASAPALCFEGCRLGAAEQSKCHGRARVACAPIEDSPDAGSFCRPLCANDEECGARACDPAHGVCTDGVESDRTFGLRCEAEAQAGVDSDADAGSDASAGALCAGLCVQLNAAPALCSRRCVFGAAGECAPASGGLRRGACVFASEGGGIGDVGYCGELCDCNDDCIEATFVCDAFEDKALESAFGHAGVCTDPALVLTHALKCAP